MRKLLAFCIGPAMALALPTMSMAQDAVDDYIFGLKYDPRTLLAVEVPGSTTSVPLRTQEATGVVICTNKQEGLTESLDEVTILSPLSGVVYPGALLRANRALADGRPDALSLPRAPLTLTVDLPGLQKEAQKTVEQPTNSSVQRAINEVLEVWNTEVASTGYVNAARSSYNVTKAYSKTQVALELGFGTEWAGNAITSNLKIDNTTTSSTTIKLYRQVFYTVSIDVPNRPSAMLAPGIPADSVRRVTDAANPPAYVRSVDYGRIIFVRMDTNSTETEADLEATLNYVTAGDATVSGSTNDKITRILKNSRFTVLALGGNADVAANLADTSDRQSVLNAIRDNSIYAQNNPAYPIAYTVAFLKDNATAVITFSTSYSKPECISYPNGYVKLKHDGGYVARFTVDWTQKDDKGNPVPKSYASGDRTAGWAQTVDLPGDAGNVRVRGEAATGLFWQPWNEAINHTIRGPDNKCYRVKGTTLHPGWDNDCK